MMLEIMTSYRGYGFSFTWADLQDMMPEEIEIVFRRQQDMLVKVFGT